MRCPHGETVRARHRGVLDDCANLCTDEAAGLRIILVADHHVLFEPVHRTVRDDRVVVADRNQGIQPERAGQQPVHQIAQPEERDNVQDLREYIGERSYDAGDCIVSGCALNISHETTSHTAYAGYRNICYLAVRNLGVPVDTAGERTSGEIGGIVFVQGEQTSKIEVKIYLSECQQFQRLKQKIQKSTRCRSEHIEQGLRNIRFTRMIRHRHILQLEVRHHGRTGAAQTVAVHHGLVRDRGEEADALLLSDIQLVAFDIRDHIFLIDDHMADDRPSCGSVNHACAIGTNSLPQAGCGVAVIGDRTEHSAGEHERSPLGVVGICRVLGQVDVTEDQVVGVCGIGQAGVGSGVVRLRAISTHAVILGAGITSVHFRTTYRQRLVIVGGISIAQSI